MEELINVTALVNSLKRLWWVPVLTLLAGTLFSIDLCERLPKIYQASTLILVEPQKIPTNYVKPIVSTTIDNRIKTIQQQVTSRSRIETIINDKNLFPTQRDRVPMEDLVAQVTRGIKLEVRGTSTFKIFYEDRDPAIAALVANSVAELFITENVNARTKEARGTTLFLEQQLDQTKKELERQEGLITEFNRAHMSELPTQRDLNFQMLEGYRSRLSTTMDAISKEEDRRIVLETQLAEMPASGLGTGQNAVSELDLKRQRLNELRSQFTEQHPEVALVKRQIADLERQLTTQAEQSDPNAQAPVGISVREQQLRTQVAEIKLKVKDLSREADRLRNLVTDYEGRVANAPQNERALLTLRRDYDILQQNYVELLRNKGQAEMAESLEQERQGEQFIVLDRAVAPARPFKPNLSQILAFGCALGLISGVVLALLFDIVLPKFRTEDELVAAFGIPVLVSVPAIVSQESHSRARGRRKLLLSTGILAALLVAAALYGFLRG
ncbi:MAG TPA: GNVR domain-containing protein [Candidatus Polarisedimenticolia bacterium]